MKIELKPSLIAQYFEHECEKYLFYNSVDAETYKTLKGSERPRNNKTASAKAGEHWEELLIEKINGKADTNLITISTKKRADEKDYLNTIDALKTSLVKGKTNFLYQSVLKTTPRFENDYLDDLNTILPVSFGFMKPDFIKAEFDNEKGKFRLTIIDAKNAGFLKIGAEIQVAIYAKILKGILEDKKINTCYVNEETGIVWNREKVTNNLLENEFDMNDASNEVHSFFKCTLNSLCSKIKALTKEKELNDSLLFRISQKCEYCTNFEDCKSFCKSNRDVRLIPYITSEAQERLDKLIIYDKELKNASLPEVAGLLRDPEKSKMLTNDCSFWKNVKNNLDAYEKSLNSCFAGKQEKFNKNGISLYFPYLQNFALFLSAQQDVDTGRMYAYSWLLKPGKGIDLFDDGLVKIYEGRKDKPGKGRYYDSIVATEPTVKEFNRIDRLFVEKIYELFEKIDNYKGVFKTDNYEDPLKHLQVYVMDHYEKINIQDALFNMLDYLDPKTDKKLYNKVSTLLLWLQGERNIAESPDQAENCLDEPVIVLTTEISNLYALSSPIGYSLKDMTDFFPDKKKKGEKEYKFLDGETEKYFGILTNVIEGMIVGKAWKQKEPKKSEELEKLALHLRKRMFIENKLVVKIQSDERVRKMRLKAPVFSLEKETIKDPELASLNFENKYEQLLQYQQIRSSRTAGVQLAIENGTILSLEYVEGNKYKILNRDSYIGEEWFTPLLCRDDEKHRIRIPLLQDKSQYITSWLEAVYKRPYPYNFKDDNTNFYKKKPFTDCSFEDDGKDAYVHFTPSDYKNSLSPKKGEKFLLFGLFRDFTGEKVTSSLKALEKAPALKTQLLDPLNYAGDTIDASAYNGSICKKYGTIVKTAFSKSQEKAFKNLFTRRLTVLEGPPATGKSNFIARSIIALSRYYMRENKQALKILITGLSHPAINNVLFKLNDMLEMDKSSDIQLIKMGSAGQDNVTWPSGKIDIKEKPQETIKEITTKPGVIQVIGATCWAAYNLSQCEFDLIVIDEASQYRAMDALIVFQKSKPDTRFLLVGDEKQLPSIIQGNYIKKEGKDIYGSVFHMFMTGLGEGHPDILSLDEQFRMNGILCKYPRTIYNKNYKAANAEIEKQIIHLKAHSSDAMLDFITDENYPLVFCEISGDDQLQTEIDCVTNLVAELKTNMEYKEGDFWNKACGIISPHHEYINRVKTSIASKLGIDSPAEVFIGTVDKLQGQEREAVIVSYGVSSIEKIDNESEFIFSMERFNVSITRGKAKTIVFLSEVLAEPNIKTNVMKFKDPDVEKGIDFIHGFTRFMKEQEPDENLKYGEFLDGKIKVWKKRLV